LSFAVSRAGENDYPRHAVGSDDSGFGFESKRLFVSEIIRSIRPFVSASLTAIPIAIACRGDANNNAIGNECLVYMKPRSCFLAANSL
jgi:hypothetical protein